MSSSDNDEVSVSLTPDEALVLFEWLSRETESEALDGLMQDPSEWVALHSLLARLESTLAAPFHPEYDKLLEMARNRLRHVAPTE